jgi:predicted GNAT family acetyltransferase
MGSLHVEATTDPVVAIERARGYLASHPVELNLIWSIMRQRVDSGAPGRYWLLELDGYTAGIVLESPPGHSVAISPLRGDLAAGMARAISDEGHRLSGVAGEASAAAAFAGCWTEEVGTAAVVEDAQRLYMLGDLVQSEGVPGRLRRAEISERGLVIEWWSAFEVETGLPRVDVSGVVDSGLSTGRLFIWDDGGARCLARATEPLGGISRIGAVFTPPSWRRRGYAAACVGALCAWVRGEEGANSTLYAQLGNPGSNAIYRRLGFQAVSEVLAYRFGEVAKHR